MQKGSSGLDSILAGLIFSSKIAPPQKRFSKVYSFINPHFMILWVWGCHLWKEDEDKELMLCNNPNKFIRRLGGSLITWAWS